ncbi:EtfB11: electron transfer flavoprotein, subunit beta [Desulfosarcina variabilis str. Montpellier]
MNIIVCVKQIPDPEAPLSDVSIDADNMEVLVDAPQVISPFDENALEVAIQLCEEHDGKITVLSMGKKLSDSVLRKALAAGADELVLLEDSGFEKLDSHSTAAVLAAAIKKIGYYDLVLTGRQAGDWDSSQVGLILSEMLDLPCISLAREIQVEDGSVIVKKTVPEGYERVKAKLPALITVSNEVGELRYISRTRMLKMMRGGNIPSWDAGEIGIAGDAIDKMQIVSLSTPPDMTRDCQYLEGSPDQQAAALAEVFTSLR